MKKYAYHLRTSLVMLVCAVLVLLMRFNLLTGLFAVANAVRIPLSDALVILGAGLCGHLYALVMFLVIFFMEFLLRSGDFGALFPLFLYLVLALTSSFFAENGWYKKKSLALGAFLILEAELSFIFYLIFVVMFHGMEGNYLTSLAITQPECFFAVLFLALYFRFAPDGTKKSFGIGLIYSSDFVERRKRKDFSYQITILSACEGILFGFIAVLIFNLLSSQDGVFSSLNESLPTQFQNQFDGGGNTLAFDLRLIRVAVFLFAATASLSVSMIVNELVIKIVVAVIKRQESHSAHLTQGFMLALAKAVDAKDHYTSGHSERVAQYAKEIARRMGKSAQEQDDIYTMGLLHDIGKIGVSEAIINKNGRLTDEEFAEIKMHPRKGYEILQNVTELPALATGARWHHERFDGRGYPDGLSGATIPEEARIIAVADAYDAMTSKRAYSDVRPQAQVRAEIERCKGSQFEPAIADIMLSMIDDDVDYKMHEGAE